MFPSFPFNKELNGKNICRTFPFKIGFTVALLITVSLVPPFSKARDSRASDLKASDLKISELHFQSPETQVSLIEVYSSQGCSSCPPAQRWVNEFTTENRLWQGIIPLVFHVDYWDYIGWSDPFAKAQYSKRQSNYKHAGRINSVYTPGFVLNGREWRGWFRQQPLPATANKVGKLKVAINQQYLSLAFRPISIPSPKPDAKELLEVNIALLGFGLRTEVKRGENARRVLPEEFVVLEHKRLPYGRDNTEIPWPKSSIQAKQYAIAVWLTERLTLRPIQATGGYIPNSWVVLQADWYNKYSSEK